MAALPDKPKCLGCPLVQELKKNWISLQLRTLKKANPESNSSSILDAIYCGGNVETLSWRNKSSMFRSIGLTR